MLRTRQITLLSLLTVSAAAGCAGEGIEESAAEVGAGDLRVRFADAKRLDLSDLSRVGTSIAAEALRDALGGNGWSAPQVYSLRGERSRVLPERFEVKSLDRIVTGLGEQLGETELSTRVQRIRRDHLEAGQDAVFIEATYSAPPGEFDRDYTIGARGFDDGEVKIGVDAAKGIESRVVVASDEASLGDLTTSMGAAMKNLRGFVNPRTFADIAKMKNGEAFGFKSFGKLGVNLNLGIPLLVADPSTLVFRVVASAGVAGVVQGEIDVELVKLSDDDFVVDFGVAKARGWTLRAGVNDEWGIKGLCDDGRRCLDVMKFDRGKEVDLRKVAEKAVARQLNRFDAIGVNAETGKATERLSVSRLHFHPRRGNAAELEKAFQQAVYNFDLRYAQALAARDLGDEGAAVEAAFDAVRWATTAKRSFGAELFGIEIFHKAVVERSVAFSVDTPAGRRSLLADVVHTDRRGVFVRDFQFARTAIASQTVDRRDPNVFKSEANLFLQGAIGDPHMTDDVIIDSLDATLLGVGGSKLIEALDTYGNEIARLVWTTCPTVETQRSAGPRSATPPTRVVDEQCNVRLLDDARMLELQTRGMNAIEPFVVDMRPDFQALVREAARLRLALQSVGIHNSDGRNGPNASFTIDARLDEKALEILMGRSVAEYRSALRTYATLMRGNRTAEDAILDRALIGKEVDDKWSDEIEEMARIFDRHAKAYRATLAVERMLPQALAGKRFVAQPLGVVYDAKNAVADIESPKLSALSQRRSEEAQQMFDALQESAKGLSRRQFVFFKRHDALSPAHAAMFPLLTLVPREHLQVGFSVRADSKSDFWTGPARYRKAGFKDVDIGATGPNVSLVGGEMFDLDEVLGKK